jgi:TolB-like protein
MGKKVSIILLFIFTSGFLLSSVDARNSRKNQNVAVTLDECVAELLSRSVSLSSRDVIRIAVLPFIPTQKEYLSDNQFGGYFTEVLTSKLSTQKQFRVFERSRLDAITKELTLNVSGLINENQAKKIGELAPIDYILTGTYTKMKSEIQINGRIINVVSGEIDAGFSRNLNMNEELNALFPESEQSPGYASDEPVNIEPQQVDPCEKLFDEFRPLFEKKEYAAIAKNASEVPFTHECIAIHSDVLYIFEKNRFVDEVFRSFLLKQLEIANPDKFSGYIKGAMKYFAIDGSIDNNEWQAILHCLKNSMKRSSYLSAIFTASDYVKMFSENEITERKHLIDSYISDADGFTDPKGSSARIMDFLNAFSGEDINADLRLYFYWIEKYGSKLQAGDIARLMSSIRELYGQNYHYAKDTLSFTKLTNTMITLTNYGKVNDSTLQIIEKYLWMYFHIYDQYSFFDNQLKVYTNSCKIELEKIYLLLPNKCFDDEMIRYCLKYGFKVPNKVPSVDTLIHDLTKEDFDIRSKAAGFLRLVTIEKPEHLKIAKKALERSIIMDETGGFYFQVDIINVIAHSKTTDPQIHKVLISCLDDDKREELCDSAIKAIGIMGKVICSSLKNEFDISKESQRLRILKSIGAMGSEAKNEINWLREKRKSATSQVLKDQIDDTIELIDR